MEKAKKISPLYVINIIITLGLMFGGGHLPSVLGLEPLGMSVLGVFFGMLYGWISLNTYIWPCLAAVLALQLSGYNTMNNILSSGFGNNVIPFLMMILVYVIFLEKAGMCTRIANFFLGQKVVVGHPWILVIFIFMSAYVMGICTYSYPAMLVPWTIAYAICEEAGYKKGDTFPALIVIGVALAAFGGYTALPIKATAVLVLGLLESTTNGAFSVSFFEYSAFMIPMTLLSVGVFVALMKFVFKADVSKLTSIDNTKFAEASKAPMGKVEKAAFVSMAAFIIMMCIPTILPQGWFITKLFKGWGMNGQLFIVLIALSIYLYDGKPMFNFTKVANSGNINWDVIIMTACCFCVAGAVQNDKTGIMAAISVYVDPILSSLSPATFIIIAFVVMALATQFMHNLVLASVMTPLVVQFGMAVGANPIVLTIFLTYAFSIAMITPAASGVAALTFSNDWAPNDLCYKSLILHFVISTALMLIIFMPIGLMLYHV